MAIGLTDVLLSLIMVAIAIGVTIWWKIPVVKDMSIGSVRAFVQLVAIGYALKYIFALESPPVILGTLLIMSLVGAHAAAGNSGIKRGAFLIALVSILAGSFITLGIMLLLDVITFEARYAIPLTGMLIGNSMNSAALTANRIQSDIRAHSHAIESALALGLSWRQASHGYQKDAVKAGMLPILNFMKTVGLVALPGAMTGMILAGAEPVEAVYLQIVVAFMLLLAIVITSVVALELSIHQFFTPHHQLQKPGD